MSRLFGPLSETISSVSWRDWALAGDQIAGAGTAAAAETAVIDLRKSRRFIVSLPGLALQGVAGLFRKPRAIPSSGNAAAITD
jgi:hypothetical protein